MMKTHKPTGAQETGDQGAGINQPRTEINQPRLETDRPRTAAELAAQRQQAMRFVNASDPARIDFVAGVRGCKLRGRPRTIDQPVTTGFTITQSQQTWLREQAAHHHISMSDIIRQLIAAAIDAPPGKPGGATAAPRGNRPAKRRF